MEEIIKAMLLEGIDESMIHRVLDVIEEEYEVVDERNDRELLNRAISKTVKQEQEWADQNPYVKRENRSTRVAKSRLLDRAARRDALAGRKQWNKSGALDAKSNNELSAISGHVRGQNVKTYQANPSSPKSRDIVKKDSASFNQPNITDAENVALYNTKSSPRIKHIQQSNK